MEQRALGGSGVDVSRVILGCGNFGGIGSSPAFFGAGETEAEAHALMDAAWEAGITTFDTADAYGGSNVDAAWLEEALRHGRPSWAQNSYSLLEREDKDEAIRVCIREGLGYTPYSPLAGGWLTGKYRRGEAPPPGSRMTLRPDPYLHFQNDRVFDALEAFEEHARKRGTSPAALAIAWLLGDPNVTAVVVGPRRPEQLRPAIEALDLQLSSSERDQLSGLFP
jgi:aryl-alcohol dehydrogenase-like predicted oxidoreductase